MAKINIGLIMDKLFRRTFFLRPLPDKSLQAIDITGADQKTLIDKTGATSIDPACFVRVRGIKRIDFIAFKLWDSSSLINIFDTQKMVVSPPNVKFTPLPITVHHPDITVMVPERQVLCPICALEHPVPEAQMKVTIPDTTEQPSEVEISVPSLEVIIPAEAHMTEKTLGDMLNEAETAGKMQAEHNPEADKKQNIILLLAAAAVLVGIFIYFKMKTA